MFFNFWEGISKVVVHLKVLHLIWERTLDYKKVSRRWYSNYGWIFNL